MDSKLLFSFTTTTLLIFFFHVLYLSLPSLSLRVYSEFVYPNFTASNLQYVSNSGSFLTSRFTTFKAAIIHSYPSEQVTNFYFCIIHVESNLIIWSANRDAPISNSDIFSLTTNGFSLLRENGQRIWSTPLLPFNSSVRVLQLQESGNLVLIDNFNRTIWQSFDHPTDTIVVGQRFPVGTLLFSGLQNNVTTTGDYSFMVIDHDAVLQWNNATYWKLSMEPLAFIDTNSPVAYLMLNRTGLYLCGNSDVVVFQVLLNNSTAFRIAQLDYDGRFRVKSFFNNKWTQEFVGPQNDCRVPDFCEGYGLCTEAVAGSNSGTCTCPSGFRTKTGSRSCLLPNAASLPPACGSETSLSSSTMVTFEELNTTGIDYFSNDFSKPIINGQDLLACTNVCSKNCSCLGYFYEQSTGSCFLLNYKLGSFFTGEDKGRKGYIKTIVSVNSKDVVQHKKDKTLPIVALVLIPTTAVSLLATLTVAGFFAWRKSRSSKTKEVKLGRPTSSNSVEIDAFSIPGLPVRFDYEELDKATNNFRNKIGSGGIEIDSRNGGDSSSSTVSLPVYFPLYALEMHEEGRYKELADPKLEGRVTNEEVEMLVRVALCCVHEDPSLRPSMVNVVSMLEGGIPLGTPRVEGLNFLRFYGRRFAEASNIEGSNVGNVFALFPQATALSGSTTTGSYGSLSYMSSQQISGPR
ncbi:G-type lectin S-receptor-like serine/threonine-protein kinase [Thalictrum thalictroides]|uniref:non-specific serine/threonine protein kinase n=1 Tax=Thalictrum thalictroides TaxID=46969 RepID=A0A7J6WZ33_THATH|nr:G-type lectin S-receptor-like serine/threonine-protein kinase [Thalictrum thalictroides]